METRVETEMGGRRDELADLGHDFDTMALLEGIADDARFEAELAGCGLDYRGAGPAPVQGQPDWLGRAFENVIRNAIRHTLPGTVVEVEGMNDSTGTLRVVVRDRGPGVPEDELEAIFEPFYRGRRPAGAGGFGLGLAIARRAVLAHGGSIRAFNREGGGLCMAIELPLARP